MIRFLVGLVIGIALVVAGLFALGAGARAVAVSPVGPMLFPSGDHAPAAAEVRATVAALQGQSVVVIDRAKLLATALGAIDGVNRQTFAEQPAEALFAGESVPTTEWLAKLGMREQYTIQMVGTVEGRITLQGLGPDAVKVADDGAVTLTLPPVELVATVSISESQIVRGNDSCPDLVCRGHDRLSVLKSVEADARAAMIQAAREDGLGARTAREAVTFYRGLLEAAGLKRVAVTVQDER